MYFLTQNAKSRGKSTEKTLDYNTEGRHIVNSISFLKMYTDSKDIQMGGKTQ